MLERSGQTAKADELKALRGKRTIGLSATNYVATKPIDVAVSYGVGAGFKTGAWAIGKFVSPVITGSKLFKYTGYGLGAGLIGGQGVIYYSDVKTRGFNEATGKLAVDLIAFTGGYKSASYGINKITDLVRTRGLTKIPADTVFSKQTVKNNKIKRGLAVSPSFKSTVKQFKRGIKGKDGFVSTASPKTLSGDSVVGGEKAGLEDLGLYVSPKGQAQPLFTRVAGLDIPKKYSFNLFADVGVSEPTVTNIYGVKNVKIYPKKVLKVAGFEAVSEYASKNVGKGFVFPTKRSMIGQGVIKRQRFTVKNDVPLGDTIVKAGSRRFEAGTSEAEAILGVGERFTPRTKRYYTEVNSRRVVIDEKDLLVNRRGKISDPEQLTTRDLIKDLAKREAEYSRLRASSKPISPGSYGFSRSRSVSTSRTSSTSSLSSISNVSGRSATSSTSSTSSLSSISNVSGRSATSSTSSTSSLSSISNVSGRSGKSGKSVISNISVVKAPISIPKIKLFSKGSELFDVTVGRFGKTKYFFAKRGVSLDEAVRFGKGKTLGTASASFKITPKSISGLKNLQSRVLTDQRFRISKNDKTRFVQKNKYRISSFGEKQQISRLGINKKRKRLF